MATGEFPPWRKEFSFFLNNQVFQCVDIGFLDIISAMNEGKVEKREDDKTS